METLKLFALDPENSPDSVFEYRELEEVTIIFCI